MLEHHAYLCKLPVVSAEATATVASQLDCQEVVFFASDAFGIDDVRTLTERAYLRPQAGEQQLLVVTFTTITVEAQQALLKLLEEPPLGTCFLFCVPESLYVLPTVLSRFAELRLHTEGTQSGETTVFQDFLRASVADRIAVTADRLAKKDHVWLAAVKTGLLSHLAATSRRYSASQLSTLMFIAEHLLTRGAANKYLLEELAFTIDNVDRAAEKS